MPQVNQPKLILYIIILLGFVGGYFYYSQGAVDETVVTPVIETGEGIEKFKDLKIDFSVLDSAKLSSLKTFGDLPVQPGQTGKRDIFAPIQ